MERTTHTDNIEDCLTVNTEGLQRLLMAGRRTAVKIGTDAGARIEVGRRVLWNVKKVQEYLDTVNK